MVGKLAYGFIAEHVPERYCIMSTQLGGAIGLLVLLLGTSINRVYVFAIVSGLLRNAWGPLSNQIWADYYGRANVGSIRGAVSPFNVVSSLGGTLFAAIVYDWLGSYEAAFWVFTVTLMIACAVSFFATPPGQSPSQLKTAEETRV
jgi:MFS family permease